jgi:hypothetical protein
MGETMAKVKVLCTYQYYTMDHRWEPAAKIVEVRSSAEIPAAFAEAMKGDCFRWDTLYGGSNDRFHQRRLQAFFRPNDARLVSYYPENGLKHF